MCNLLVTALIIALSLNVSGSVELNPGPMKKCPKCEKMMPTRFYADVVICYVMLPAARVLHFSAFIINLYHPDRSISGHTNAGEFSLVPCAT